MVLSFAETGNPGTGPYLGQWPYNELSLRDFAFVSQDDRQLTVGPVAGGVIDCVGA